MIKRWLKRIVSLTAFGAVVAGFAFALRPEPAVVDLASVEYGPVTVTIVEEGRTQIRDVYQVFAPVAGEIDRSTLDVGDPVRAGLTIIAEIHPARAAFRDERTRRELEARRQSSEAAVGQAEAEVRRAQSDYGLAKAELGRTDYLHGKGIASRAAFDRATAKLETTKEMLLQAIASLRMRRSDLESARARLIPPTAMPDRRPNGCCVTVIAPHDGVALSIPSKSERVVTQGTLLAEVGDPDDLEIVVDLLSSDAVRIAPGTPVRILQWGGTEALQARVRRIDPVGFTKVSALGIEEQRVGVVLDLVSKPAKYGRLDHGFRVSTEIIAKRIDRALRLPLGALFRDDNAWAVFRIEGETAHLVRIDTGIRDTSHVQVLGGLNEGDRVVVYPGNSIEDGSSVEDRAAPRENLDTIEGLRNVLKDMQSWFSALVDSLAQKMRFSD